MTTIESFIPLCVIAGIVQLKPEDFAAIMLFINNALTLGFLCLDLSKTHP